MPKMTPMQAKAGLRPMRQYTMATSMALTAVLMVRQPTWSRKSLRGNSGMGLYLPLDS